MGGGRWEHIVPRAQVKLITPLLFFIYLSNTPLQTKIFHA